MKATLILLSFLLLTSVTGCHSENDDPNSDYNIDGQWNLTHVGGGIDGRDLNFDPGVIIWTFNENTGMVNIVNDSENGLSVFQSGTYPFSIEDFGDHKTITINGMYFGSLEILQNQIHINQQVADGILMELDKINFEHF
jgi:hypothetical protein